MATTVTSPRRTLSTPTLSTCERTPRNPTSRHYAKGEMEVVNDYEVVFRLSAPNAEMLRLISELNMSSLDISSGVGRGEDW